MAAAQRSLTRLRHLQGWQLQTVYVAGLAWYRHRVGAEWTRALAERTGLFVPPRTLPRRLTPAQDALLERWRASGVGPFVDTTEQGVALGRRGRYAHNSDHTAHLMLIREGGTLLVRQVRRVGDTIWENRTSYRRWFGGWVIHDSQLRQTLAGADPTIVQEEHYFRDADAFRQEAPSFFPFISDGRTWREVRDSDAAQLPDRR